MVYNLLLTCHFLCKKHSLSFYLQAWTRLVTKSACSSSFLLVCAFAATLNQWFPFSQMQHHRKWDMTKSKSCLWPYNGRIVCYVLLLLKWLSMYCIFAHKTELLGETRSNQEIAKHTLIHWINHILKYKCTLGKWIILKRVFAVMILCNHFVKKGQ